MFPDLFKLRLQPDISVSQMKQNSVSFTRWLVDDLKIGCDKIKSNVEEVILTPGEDVVFWKFGKNGCFSVKSVYKALTMNDAGPYFKKIWKGKIPAVGSR